MISSDLVVLKLVDFCNRVDGTWVTFTGDQLGTLFAGRILAQYKASGKPLGMSWSFSLVHSYKCFL
jgi:hypothetical protein